MEEGVLLGGSFILRPTSAHSTSPPSGASNGCADMTSAWQVWLTISPRAMSAQPLDVDGIDNVGIDLM
ncbi:hypothetical protein CRG98_014791 [Punica granatum]|uniref:Uncharacterized protein n=1 Tax=Punica granatum TaxID=22663 RepID=A0A2I0K8C6_PUNGR|nr:hypothetical protein CRG98_014791 [Punica granatum]